MKLLFAVALLGITIGSNAQAQEKPNCAIGEVRKYVEVQETVLSSGGDDDRMPSWDGRTPSVVVDRVPGVLVTQHFENDVIVVEVYGQIQKRGDPTAETYPLAASRKRYVQKTPIYYWPLKRSCRSELDKRILATFDSDVRSTVTVRFM